MSSTQHIVRVSVYILKIYFNMYFIRYLPFSILSE